jgi:hypothetical protein
MDSIKVYKPSKEYEPVFIVLALMRCLFKLRIISPTTFYWILCNGVERYKINT